MPVKFHFLDAFDEIPRRLREAIQGELDDALARILLRLPIDRVDIVVAPSNWVIPEYGLNGFAHGKGRITFSIDPSSPRIEDAERAQRILGLLAHELHHVVRTRGPDCGKTLGEALVSEGLAQCCEEEVGAPTPFYAVYLDAEALRRVGQKAREHIAAENYDHNAWFFGRRGDLDWPRNAGYSLGYTLVKAWLGSAGTTASASAEVPAKVILDPWVNRTLPIHPSV